jgi:hypothetical protein
VRARAVAVTPLDAVKDEVRAELDALARRLGAAPVPDAIVIRVEFDRETHMPRVVDCQEERRRRILGPCTRKRDV